MKLAIIGSGMIANEFLSIYHNIDGIHIKSIYGRVSSKEKLNRILALNTSQSYEKIKIDTERDYFMDANEALEYGIIDKVIKKAA